MRTEQEYRNLEAENASLRERLEKAEKDAERSKFLSDKLLSVDFDWDESGDVALIFKWNPEWRVSANYEATIDAAIKAQKEGKS